MGGDIVQLNEKQKAVLQPHMTELKQLRAAVRAKERYIQQMLLIAVPAFGDQNGKAWTFNDITLEFEQNG